MDNTSNPIIPLAPVNPQTTEQSSGEIFANLSKNYLDSNLDKSGKVLEAVGVTSYLEEEGILKGIDREGVKTILASMSTFYLMYQAKKHWKIVLPTAGVLALLLYLTKKPKAIVPISSNVKSTSMGIRG
jgi:hypothetical protein